MKRSSNVGSTKYVIFSGGTSGGNTGAFIVFLYDDNLYIGGNNNNFLITTQVFRDFSSWYHLVITLDTTQSTVANRLRVYINGVEITTFSTDVRSTYVTQNSDLGINLAEAHHIGSQAQGGPVAYFAGYLADIYFIDGQALDPTSFGEFDATTGVWNPKAYTGSYGTNGFHLG
ncbi:MAG: hypothetical protein EBS29_09510 [Chloroflexia bacterium]|nr:hypothetical protein [Chloroflexia bacterium]